MTTFLRGYGYENMITMMIIIAMMILFIANAIIVVVTIMYIYTIIVVVINLCISTFQFPFVSVLTALVVVDYEL